MSYRLLLLFLSFYLFCTLSQAQDPGSGAQIDSLLQIIEEDAKPLEARLSAYEQLLERGHDKFSGDSLLSLAQDFMELAKDQPLYTARATEAIAMGYRRKNEHKKADSTFEVALKMYQTIGDEKGQGTTWEELAIQEFRSGDKQLALAKFDSSIYHARKAKDQITEASALKNKGTTLAALSQYQRSLDLLEQPLQIFQEIGNQQGMASIYNDRGTVYGRMGKYDKTLEEFNKSLVIRREMK